MIKKLLEAKLNPSQEFHLYCISFDVQTNEVHWFGRLLGKNPSLKEKLSAYNVTEHNSNRMSALWDIVDKQWACHMQRKTTLWQLQLSSLLLWDRRKHYENDPDKKMTLMKKT